MIRLKFASGLLVFTALNCYAQTMESAPPPMSTSSTDLPQKHQITGMGDMTDEQKDLHLKAMQEHMLLMHEFSDRIIHEKDAAKKQLLKDQQLHIMKTHKAQMLGELQKMRDQKTQTSIKHP